MPFMLAKLFDVTEPAFTPETAPTDILGGTEFACTQEQGLDHPPTGDNTQYFWRCFEHLSGTTTSDWQVGDINGTPLDLTRYYWAKFYNPYPLRLKTFSWRVHDQPDYGITALRLSASNDDLNYTVLGEKTDIPVTAETLSLTITDQNFYKYYRVECKPIRTDWMLLTDVFYTGQEKRCFALSGSFKKFEQPILTENGVWGGDKFAVSASSEHSAPYLAYKAFDGSFADNSDWHPSTPYENQHEIKWYNPNPLKMNGVTIWQTGAHGYCLRDYQILASNDDVTWDLICTGYATAEKGGSYYIVVNCDKTYKYWSIKALSSNHASLSPIVTYGEIQIDAYEFVGMGKKTIPWTQPELTAQPTTWGKDEFSTIEDDGWVTDATGAQRFWRLFQRPYNGADEWQYNGVAVGTVLTGKFYNPKALVFNKIAFSNHSSVDFAPSAIRLYGSNDDLSYELMGEYPNWPKTYPGEIAVPLTKHGPYKYVKVEMTVRSEVCCVLPQIFIDACELIPQKLLSFNYAKPWTQPLLTSEPVKDPNGFWTEDEYRWNEGETNPDAVDYLQQIWRLFDGNQVMDWQMNGVDVNKYYWGKFHNPKRLLISDFAIFSSQPTYYPSEIILSGSNDDKNYERIGTIVVENPVEEYYSATITKKAFYKHFKVEVKPRNTTASLISLVRITALEEQ